MIGKTISHYRIVEKLGGGGMGSLVYDRFNSPDGGIFLLELKTRHVSMLPDSKGFFSPVWPPDGRYIAAQPTDAPNQVIYDFETRKWHDLADLRPGYPNWSQDGKYVYFTLTASWEKTRLFTVCGFPIARQSVSEPQRHSASQCRPRPLDGPCPGCLPIGSQEIYALDWEAP